MILLGNCVYWTCGQPVRMAGYTVVVEPTAATITRNARKGHQTTCTRLAPAGGT